MSGRTLAADVMLSLSLLIIVLAAFGAVVMRTTFGKLHFITPVTTVGAPLFCAALVVDSTWSIATGLEILTTALVMLSGPILEAAIGRVGAQQRQIIEPEGPQ
ncbi:MAG TPA: monovalent cation/H(+) antiporter subunit G [Mycobacteriales bacterium]|nr:monovalent cation/H(+) antiporter subunit G [Mycobacteriales bacterium]